MALNILMSKIRKYIGNSFVMQFIEKTKANQRERNVTAMQDNMIAFTESIVNDVWQIHYDELANKEAFTNAFVEACQCTNIYIALQKYNEAPEGSIKEAWCIRCAILRNILTN